MGKAAGDVGVERKNRSSAWDLLSLRWIFNIQMEMSGKPSESQKRSLGWRQKFRTLAQRYF